MDEVATKIAWANSAHTSAWIYEEGSTATGMGHETVTIAALKSGGYAPWKYKTIS